MPSFAYLFERFPAFTQTFVVREALEILRQGMEPLFVSLHAPEQELSGHFPAEAREQTIYLPDQHALVTEIKRRRSVGELPRAINQRLEKWGSEPDKLRLYEAIFTGDLLSKRKIRHIHAHFAGLAARTAFLIKELYGIEFSWTGHAQDIFCETEYKISLSDLIREARLIVTETDYSAAFLQKKYPEAAGKIHRVYNGIDLPASRPERLPPGLPRILSVGRLIEKKGFDILIEACAILKNSGANFECWIVGEGPLHAVLQQQIKQADLSNCVALIGPRSQPEIAELLKTSAVFSLASRQLPNGDSDNFPTVITEAMTFALPVVATTLAGIPEQVLDGKTGFLIPSGNAAALAEALHKTISQPSLASALGQAGWNHANAHFGRETTVRHLRQLLGKHTRVSAPWQLRLADTMARFN